MDAIAENIPTIRELMPPGFLPALCKATGTANLSNMSQVVSLENSRSSAWPAVLALAEKTNAKGFARWAEANPDKLPKVAA
jgi:hypothetical protein